MQRLDPKRDAFYRAAAESGFSWRQVRILREACRTGSMLFSCLVQLVLQLVLVLLFLAIFSSLVRLFFS